MAEFAGYYDTGGTETERTVVATAGVVAAVDEWRAFDIQWLDVLRRYEISSFTMKEISHWKGDIGLWPPKNGRRDEERRAALLGELIDAASGVQQIFVRAVILPDFNAANKTYRLRETFGGGPYLLAQAACLLQSQEWLRDRHRPASEHHWSAFIEQGDSGQDRFRDFCREYLAYQPQFVEKKAENGEDVTPLALADLLAYEHRLLYERKLSRIAAHLDFPRSEWRGLIREMKARLRIHGAIIEADAIAKMCRRLRIPLREP